MAQVGRTSDVVSYGTGLDTLPDFEEKCRAVPNQLHRALQRLGAFVDPHLRLFPALFMIGRWRRIC